MSDTAGGTFGAGVPVAGGRVGLGRDVEPAPEAARTWAEAVEALRQRASDLKRAGRAGEGRTFVRAADYLAYMEAARLCPQDPRHTYDAHRPGGAWYGYGHGGQASPYPAADEVEA